MTERRGLSPDALTDAAIEIVETDGPTALTLSRVARDLDVKPPSLYNHVDGLDGLRRNVALRAAEQLGGRLGAAAMGRSGRAALEAIASEARAYATEHPGLYELTAQARPDDEEFAIASKQAVEPVLAVLRGFDISGDDAIHAARAIRSAVHGFVSLERVGGFGLDVEIDGSFAWLVESLAECLEHRSSPHSNA